MPCHPGASQLTSTARSAAAAERHRGSARLQCVKQPRGKAGERTGSHFQAAGGPTHDVIAQLHLRSQRRTERFVSGIEPTVKIKFRSKKLNLGVKNKYYMI